jgi:hypothetical protein
VLSRFTAMEELILPDASNLHVGFDPPMCGNAYMDTDGEELLKQVLAEGKLARKSVAKMVFEACSSLKTLWVGDSNRADAVKNEKGGLSVVEWYYEDRPAPSGWVV